MVFGKNATGKGFGPAAQKAFLAHLAQTSNVSASAKAAGVTTSPVYDLRKKSADFCAKWLAALSEGYRPQGCFCACGQGWVAAAVAA